VEDEGMTGRHTTRRFGAPTVLCVAFLAVAGAAAEPHACPATLARIAVGRLGAAYDGVGIDLGAVAATQLASALLSTECFTVREAGFPANDDPDWLVLGEVSAAQPAARRRFAVDSALRKLPVSFGAGASRSRGVVSLELRLVEAKTGNVLAAFSTRGPTRGAGGFLSARGTSAAVSADGDEASPLAEGTRLAADAAAREIVSAARRVFDPASSRAGLAAAR
jgi:curli biogenesis system outer membrane secretion channel CsgG